MRGLSYFCLSTATLYALAAMALGIYMAASHDHALSPTHAHLNLVGWVSVALYGLYYHAVPAASASRLARIQVAAATLGIVLLAPGIALANFNITEAPAVAGALVTLVSMLLFATVVLSTRTPPAAQ